MTQDSSPHNRSEPDFSIINQGSLWGAPLEIFKSIHSLNFLSDLAELGAGFFDFCPEGVGERRLPKIRIAFRVRIGPIIFFETWWSDIRHQSTQSFGPDLSISGDLEI